MKFTRKETVSWHRKMWNWIANRIEEEQMYQDIADLKKEYCNQNNVFIRNDCFCCEYTKYICDYCPIEWKSEVEYFMCLDKYEDNDYKGLYGLCCDESDWKEQAELARKIANLPERQDV